MRRATGRTARPRWSRYVSREHEVVLRGPLVDDRPTQVRDGRASGWPRSIVVGPALAAEQFPDSHLYSDARCRS